MLSSGACHIVGKLLHLPQTLLHMQVAIPIPEPKGFMTADRYKIQFTFDGKHLLL